VRHHTAADAWTGWGKIGSLAVRHRAGSPRDHVPARCSHHAAAVLTFRVRWPLAADTGRAGVSTAPRTSTPALAGRRLADPPLIFGPGTVKRLLAQDG